MAAADKQEAVLSSLVVVMVAELAVSMEEVAGGSGQDNGID